jgi:hypothetical protein
MSGWRSLFLVSAALLPLLSPARAEVKLTDEQKGEIIGRCMAEPPKFARPYCECMADEIHWGLTPEEYNVFISSSPNANSTLRAKFSEFIHFCSGITPAR